MHFYSCRPQWIFADELRKAWLILTHRMWKKCVFCGLLKVEESLTRRQDCSEGPENVWRLVLAELKRELTESEFAAYIEPTRFVGCEGDVLLLEAQNSFTHREIEKRFTGIIGKIANDITQGKWKFRYIVAKEKNVSSKEAKKKISSESVVKEKANNLQKQKRDLKLPEEDLSQPNLNAKYTMEAFVVGENNRFAHAVSLAVTTSPGDIYNPVFLYGGVGLGKTHLMQAIGHCIYDRNNKARVLYVTSEVFSNDFIAAIQTNRARSFEIFRKKYRDLDVLLIDDVQFFSGKEGLQEEFFHTFNELYQGHKQIVLSSDRPPKALHGLQERLVSRFESGVLADIRAPEYETRLAILGRIASSTGISVGNEELSYLAEKMATNIRALEGAFTRIVAFASLTKQPLTITLIEEQLKDLSVVQAPRRLTIDTIREEVCKYFELSVEEIVSRRRSRRIVFPRQIAMFLSRDLTEETLAGIGKAFGKDDHTTVIHACEKIDKLLSEGAPEGEAIRTLRILLKELKHS